MSELPWHETKARTAEETENLYQIEVSETIRQKYEEPLRAHFTNVAIDNALVSYNGQAQRKHKVEEAATIKQKIIPVDVTFFAQSFSNRETDLALREIAGGLKSFNQITGYSLVEESEGLDFPAEAMASHAQLTPRMH